MRIALARSFPTALFALFALAAAGCGSGSKTADAERTPCLGGEAFCIVSCDLGCGQIGCGVSAIAENQRIKFRFSDRVQVASVNSASVSIRTPTGNAPEGDYLVNGAEVTFVPRVRTVAGVSTFGFQRNETYIVTLAGGVTAPFGVKNLSGVSLASEFTCTVVASQGILDEDQQPPQVTLVAPTNLTTAPLDTTVVLRWSELIDTTALRGVLNGTTPVRFTLRRTFLSGGARFCDRDSAGIVLEGLGQLDVQSVNGVPVTVLTFRPPVTLPGESCLEVLVSGDVRDLSGRSGSPTVFRILTEAGVSTPIEFRETFSGTEFFDPQLSSNPWSNGARPGLLGGDGRHGSFDPTFGQPVGQLEYNWDTTQFTIPASNTLDNQEAVVTDGKFYFTDFRVPPGVVVNFIGPNPPQIYVTGRAQIDGSLRLNGAPMTNFNAVGLLNTVAPVIPGQAGGAPGAGGGRGGAGGNECQGTGPIGCSGTNGEDVRLLAGHAYAGNATNTGGRGSSVFPTAGSTIPLVNTPAITGFRAAFAFPGGGGGFTTQGTAGSVAPLAGIGLGPNPGLAQSFSLFPYPPVAPPPDYTALNHFLVGGSGGGGGGSHPFGTTVVSTSPPNNMYSAGSGGSGGGGALALRTGGNLTVAASATLQARGGAGVLIRGNDPGGTANNISWGISCPGGGGSGGSFLLQAGGDLNVAGPINTSGGEGSRTGQITFFAGINVNSQAGAGSPGFYRLETAGNLNFNAVGSVPAYNASLNNGPLTDRDSYTASASLWRSSNRVFPPQWLRYEMQVDTDGDGNVDVTYTDSGEVGTSLANDPAGPVTVRFQGAQMSQSSTEPIAGTLGRWRFGVGTSAGPGINQDSPIGFRFLLTFNRRDFPNCVVRDLRVFARS
ncbi:MAG: Ig-like domain-containing protein [Planctomycetes bacterium]|nr:Ig-like domain-containing protein [Planctomycetota bacterium]